MAELIKEIQDLTYLSFDRIRNSSGTAGSFLKAYSTINGHKVYYKLSCYDSVNGITGHENINELIADRLLDIFGYDHLHYRLIHANVLVNDKEITTYVCASDDFKRTSEDKIAFDEYYEIYRNSKESRIEFAIRNGFAEEIYRMFVLDFIILNRDRHGANVEVLRDCKTHKIRLAPMFDHGMSLFAPCRDMEEISRFDVMEDKKVNSYFGSNSSYGNLKLIPSDKMPAVPEFSSGYRMFLFDGLSDVIDSKLEDKIWEMIEKRWRYYEDFCRKK